MVVKTARDKMCLVLRLFPSRKRSLMLTLSLVSFPEQNIAVSSGIHGRQDLQAIEAFQRTIVHKIIEVQHLNYWEILHKLKLHDHTTQTKYGHVCHR